MFMKYASIVLLFGFVGVAVFGFLAMNHVGAEGHGGCLAAQARNTECPGSGDSDLGLFHINAFKSFSLAIVLAVLSLAVFFSLSKEKLLVPIAFQGTNAPEVFEFTSFRAFREWLTLLENSPSYA